MMAGRYNNWLVYLFSFRLFSCCHVFLSLSHSLLYRTSAVKGLTPMSGESKKIPQSSDIVMGSEDQRGDMERGDEDLVGDGHEDDEEDDEEEQSDAPLLPAHMSLWWLAFLLRQENDVLEEAAEWCVIEDGPNKVLDLMLVPLKTVALVV